MEEIDEIIDLIIFKIDAAIILHASNFRIVLHRHHTLQGKVITKLCAPTRSPPYFRPMVQTTTPFMVFSVTCNIHKGPKLDA